MTLLSELIIFTGILESIAYTQRNDGLSRSPACSGSILQADEGANLITPDNLYVLMLLPQVLDSPMQLHAQREDPTRQQPSFIEVALFQDIDRILEWNSMLKDSRDKSSPSPSMHKIWTWMTHRRTHASDRSVAGFVLELQAWTLPRPRFENPSHASPHHFEEQATAEVYPVLGALHDLRKAVANIVMIMQSLDRIRNAAQHVPHKRPNRILGNIGIAASTHRWWDGLSSDVVKLILMHALLIANQVHAALMPARELLLAINELDPEDLRFARLRDIVLSIWSAVEPHIAHKQRDAITYVLWHGMPESQGSSLKLGATVTQGQDSAAPH